VPRPVSGIESGVIGGIAIALLVSASLVGSDPYGEG